MKHGFYSVAILMLLLALGRWSCARMRRPRAVAAPVPAQVLTLVPTSAQKSEEVRGVIKPTRETILTTKFTGRVARVFVHEGDAVRAGQTLALLDGREMESSIAQAQANLQSAIVGAESARVAANMEAAMSVARLDQARAGVRQCEAALATARSRLQLVQVGPRPEELAQATETVNEAKANLALAQRDKERMQNLFADGAISRQQIDTVRTHYEVALTQFNSAAQSKQMVQKGSRAEVVDAARNALSEAEAQADAARAMLQQAQAQSMQVQVRRQELRAAQSQVARNRADYEAQRLTRDEETLRAPFAGIVGQCGVEAGALAGPGVPLIRLSGGDLYLEVPVPSAAIASARPGTQVPVMLDTAPWTVKPGRIVAITQQLLNGNSVCIAKILPPFAGLYAGMVARVRFQIDRGRLDLNVPVSAIWESQGQHYVTVLDSYNVAHPRTVSIGPHNGAVCPVLTGLRAGERLIVAADKSITAGAHIVPHESPQGVVRR